MSAKNRCEAVECKAFGAQQLSTTRSKAAECTAAEHLQTGPVEDFTNVAAVVAFCLCRGGRALISADISQTEVFTAAAFTENCSGRRRHGVDGDVASPGSRLCWQRLRPTRLAWLGCVAAEAGHLPRGCRGDSFEIVNPTKNT